MKQINSLLLLIICCYQFSNGQTKTKQAFSSLDVFELEWVTTPQISPNGQQIVFAQYPVQVNGMFNICYTIFR